MISIVVSYHCCYSGLSLFEAEHEFVTHGLTPYTGNLHEITAGHISDNTDYNPGILINEG
jgi:hypothetical protein